MLSGEGMQRRVAKRWKTTVGLISKSKFARAAHFFVHFFAVALNDYNVKLPETSQLPVLWRKCRTCSRSLFFTAVHFHLALVAATISHFVTADTIFSCILCFLSLALNPCRPFSRWASLACSPLSLFLCLSLALYSKFVDMTIYLSLIL